MSDKLTRREFLKIAGLAFADYVAASLLSACGAPATERVTFLGEKERDAKMDQVLGEPQPTFTQTEQEIFRQTQDNIAYLSFEASPVGRSATVVEIDDSGIMYLVTSPHTMTVENIESGTLKISRPHISSDETITGINNKPDLNKFAAAKDPQLDIVVIAIQLGSQYDPPSWNVSPIAIDPNWQPDSSRTLVSRGFDRGLMKNSWPDGFKHTTHAITDASGNPIIEDGYFNFTGPAGTGGSGKALFDMAEDGAVKLVAIVPRAGEVIDNTTKEVRSEIAVAPIGSNYQKLKTEARERLAKLP